MKNYVLVLIVLGLTNQMIAQKNVAIVIKKNGIHYNKANFKTASRPVKNIAYLTAVKDDYISKKIVKFQNIVASYNIKNAKVYSPKRRTTYTVKFRENNSRVTAIYNKDGELLSCKENYQAIRLPYRLSSQLAKQYPGWKFKQIHCDIQYIKDTPTTLLYTVVLEHESKTKTVKLSA